MSFDQKTNSTDYMETRFFGTYVTKGEVDKHYVEIIDQFRNG